MNFKFYQLLYNQLLIVIVLSPVKQSPTFSLLADLGNLEYLEQLLIEL